MTDINPQKNTVNLATIVSSGIIFLNLNVHGLSRLVPSILENNNIPFEAIMTNILNKAIWNNTKGILIGAIIRAPKYISILLQFFMSLLLNGRYISGKSYLS